MYRGDVALATLSGGEPAHAADIERLDATTLVVAVVAAVMFAGLLSMTLSNDVFAKGSNGNGGNGNGGNGNNGANGNGGNGNGNGNSAGGSNGNSGHNSGGNGGDSSGNSGHNGNQ
jgi:hypothetical protein